MTVIKGKFKTYGEIPTADVLDGAKHLKSVLVIGYDENGDAYYASTHGDDELLVYMIEKFKHRILNGDFE